MKLEILQENLIKGLSVVGRAVTSKPQIPILANILLATEEGRLKITATNLEIGITTWVGAKVLKEGAFTVPARTFIELVSTLPAGKVELELTEGQLLITAGGFKAKINGIPAAEFPSTGQDKAEEARKNILELDTGDFVEAVNKTSFSAAMDESRPVLTGVLFKFTEKGLDLVATDGFRLSLKKLEGGSLKGKTEEFEKMPIVPVKALLEAARIVGESKDRKTVKISFSPAEVKFLLEDVWVTARLIEGNFPSYEKIIPEKGSLKITADSQSLGRAVRTAGIFARDSANIVKFVKGSSANFIVKANAAQVGENETEVEAKMEGDDIDLAIAFNYRYLLDFLGSLGKEEQVIMEFSGPLAPGVFRIPSDPEFLHIIMPVRVQN